MTGRDALRLSVVLILVVAAGDYGVGTEISFSIFYFLPISVAAWYAGRGAGYGVSVVSAFCWLANDLWIGHQAYSAAWIPYWNAFMRLMIFLIVVTLLAHWKRALSAERRAHLELDRARRDQLELKDQLLSNVSHELRTPLTAAQQFVAIMLDGIAGPMTDRQTEYLDTVQRNLKQLGRMIGDLLDTARSGSGKLSIEISRVRIDELVAELVRTARPPAAEHGVELVLEAAAPVPEVLSDAGRVRQVVTNLLDNAL
ncbi:MAG: HAMP domain-containing sensor histidine kinase, partial [Longimicrobiales bacterium]|nr:HAMP domain-containing sensor histidine kinase [Longimicrobiales bacterium]